MIDVASQRFDDRGRLISDRHAEQIRRLVAALRDRIRGPRAA
jgi:hypothetical protein